MHNKRNVGGQTQHDPIEEVEELHLSIAQLEAKKKVHQATLNLDPKGRGKVIGKAKRKKKTPEPPIKETLKKNTTFLS